MTALTSKEKQLKTIVGVVAGIITYFFVQWSFFSPPSFDKTMMNIASEINKTCPIMVDSETRLDNTSALPDNELVYNYTLVKLTVDEVDVNELVSNIKPMLVNNISTNPDMKNLRDHEVTMSYYYKDKDGNFITKVSITSDEYQ